LSETDTHVVRLESRRLRWVAALLGVGFGVLAGLRLLDTWQHAGQPIPTEALIFLGGFFLVAGIIQLTPEIWRRRSESAIWGGKTTFGKMPSRDALPGWRRGLWDLQEWVIARDQRRRQVMRRGPAIFRLRYGLTPVVAGATILIYAALR
jgi:hypothetical protein